MKFGYSEACRAHDPGSSHPERPERLEAIRRALETQHGVRYVDADPGGTALIERVHEPAYLADVKTFCTNGGGNWDPDTIATGDTWAAIQASAGLSRWTAEAAMDGSSGRNTPFALTRPPGHHATSDDAMGFCFSNNAAVAAQYAIDETPADRVAIFDWDVHHGNGTQEIFFDREDVLFVSVHQAGLYPNSGETTATGTGDGTSRTVNVPLPPGSGDNEYEYVHESVVRPAVESFDADLLLVSAGFDAHRDDPISRMHLTTDGYGLLTERVRDLASDVECALGFVLEGGYNLDTLSGGVRMVHEVFDGREPAVEGGSVDAHVRTLAEELKRSHQGVGSK